MTARYRLEHVVRRYEPLRSSQAIEALCVPSLEVPAGDMLGVVGPNGSGKSTLLETMAFLSRPDEGRLLLDGLDVWSTGQSFAARRRCPMLLQRPVLFKSSVLRNVMYGLRIRGLGRIEARRKAEHVLRLTRLDGLAQRSHRELSGGEQQRVALARILALDPEVLLLDEPTAHVDYFNARLIEEIIRDFQANSGTTIILATHDPVQAQVLGRRVVTLLDGQLLDGTTENLWNGRISGAGNRFTFHGDDGPAFHFTANEVVDQHRSFCRQARDNLVWLVLAPDCLELEPAEASDDGELVGTIASIEQQANRYRVTVRLPDRQRILAGVPLTRGGQCGVAIGDAVRLRLGAQAIRVVPIRRCENSKE